jgi:hypothetical protein
MNRGFAGYYEYYILKLLRPPSHPSPTGEGESKSFPPWGKHERGLTEL